MSTRDLAAWILRRYGHSVPDDFKWFRRAFSGSSTVTLDWATWLAELTGAAPLDQMTLTPWRLLVSNECLTARQDRWCPKCFKDDLKSARQPYLRLLWDIAEVGVCPVHKVELACTCPHCGKSRVTHRASTVLPGYCTRCRGFLGDQTTSLAQPKLLWSANQVGRMLARAPSVGPDAVPTLIEEIILAHTGGNLALFAHKIGMSKSTVWHWVHGKGVPTLRAWLAICLYTSRELEHIFAGDLKSRYSLEPKGQTPLPLDFTTSPRKGIRSRKIDWHGVRAQLDDLLVVEPPISLTQACELLAVDIKQVYQHANLQARTLAERHRSSRQDRRTHKTESLKQWLSDLQQTRAAEGYAGLSAREVWERLPTEMRSVRHLFKHINSTTSANDEKTG